MFLIKNCQISNPKHSHKSCFTQLIEMASADGLTSTKPKEEITPSPGELVLKKLFAQFVVTTESKLKYISTQPIVSHTLIYTHLFPVG